MGLFYFVRTDGWFFWLLTVTECLGVCDAVIHIYAVVCIGSAEIFAESTYYTTTK
jgi:hypothetical protein